MDDLRKVDVSVIVPLYNEEHAFAEHGPRLVQTLEDSQLSYELICVVNGCRDATQQVCDALRYRTSMESLKSIPVRTVILPQNQGYGGGIQAGLRVAKGKIVGYTCGDGQVNPWAVVMIANSALAHYTLAKAVRTTREDNWIRSWISVIYNAVARFYLGIPYRDLNAMPKFWPRDLIPKLESKDWFIDVELLLRWWALEEDITEVPLYYYARTHGHSYVHLRTIWEFIRNLWMCTRDGRYERWTGLF